jgi:hypothetical protein
MARGFFVSLLARSHASDIVRERNLGGEGWVVVYGLAAEEVDAAVAG